MFRLTFPRIPAKSAGVKSCASADRLSPDSGLYAKRLICSVERSQSLVVKLFEVGFCDVMGPLYLTRSPTTSLS